MKLLSHKQWKQTLIRVGMAFCLTVCLTTWGLAQANNGGNNTGNQNNQNNNNQNAGGITIDANGVISAPFRITLNSKRLNQKRLQALAAQALPGDVNQKSEFRKISLVQLEKVCQAYKAKGEPLPVEVRFLAGLWRIDYLFVDRENNDLIIAGPAEGFATNAQNRVVCVESGRPPLRLDDLVVALQSQQRGLITGCSFDAKQENLARMHEYIRRTNNASSSATAVTRFRTMAQILGMQDVTVTGVPAGSHYARVLVEADYMLKRISIGLEPSGIREIKSHLATLRGGGNSTQRWWFTPLYDAFTTTADRDAFQFSGQRLQMMSQEEFVNLAGQRTEAAQTRVSTTRYAQQFTKYFAKLADLHPTFAELQSITDLTVLAALIRKERLDDQVGWGQRFFLSEADYLVPEGNIPTQVPTAMNYKQAGGLMICLVGGGVTINARAVLRQTEFVTTRDDTLAEKKQSVVRQDGVRWWWD
ncbi:hypothetical protein Pan153_13930 [Gimesia panareensis]|uniref:DUF1598 domain-containing protein n=1 Tax=Gimesia panareensis TaxID=2527978 RepID=A0A518FK92_9PLAN|nr:DUF1598 domain-containing protein [Gimesia panareensis]QDV16761.1 hypothetical protein Pan153_13930 [Gimesia panareensis]